MSLDPFGFPAGRGGFGDFDDLVNRFFGGDPLAGRGPVRQVQRVDVSRLLSQDARALIGLAARQAREWGSPDLDVEHLLWAATQSPPTQQLLERAGVDVDELAARMEALAEHGDPQEATPELTPAAKRVLLEAHNQSQAAGASYIGPEHVLLGVVNNPETPAAQALGGALAVAGQDGETGPGRPRGQWPPARGGGPARGQGGQSATPTLDQYGRDLTAAAREGKLDPVVGREAEVEQTLEVLSRRTKNNPVLIGDPGVGKTAIVEGIASRMSTATCRTPSPASG